jgi:GNAT superfamily N-acetyltransferase
LNQAAEVGTTIRRATLDDVELLADLRARFVAGVRCVDYDEWNAATREESRTFFASAMTDGRYVSWIADAGEGVVGCVGLSLIAIPPRTREGHVNDGLVLTMWVEPEWRSRGVGRLLMEELLAAREELGIHRLLLHATDAGRPLYESLGFRANPTLMDLD